MFKWINTNLLSSELYYTRKCDTHTHTLTLMNVNLQMIFFVTEPPCSTGGLILGWQQHSRHNYCTLKPDCGLYHKLFILELHFRDLVLTRLIIEYQVLNKMFPFRSRSINPDTTIKIVFTWLIMKAKFLIKSFDYLTMHSYHLQAAHSCLKS